MNGQAGFTLRGRNPDVLTCIANLSNDEVFTPPAFANRMLEGLTSFPDAFRMLGVRKTATFYEAARELGVTP